MYINITKLARILKITPKELHDFLPQLGYDIGRRAIKINKNVANKIIKDWPVLKKRLRKEKQAEDNKPEEENKVKAVKSIEVSDFITPRELAALSGLPVNIILAELMKNGIFISLNERIDFETVWLVGSELGIKVKPKKEKRTLENGEKDELKDILAREKKSSLRVRPPVIVVMGHVDHGKTKLLDAIRRTNIVEEEAGGITQHIGAYQVARRGRLITFIDTPGHEAFTAMRGRGARVADIAILVVAADDGVKPQTIEAYRIIEAAKIPLVVAINKIDKPGANIEKTKQELSSRLNVVPEDWGGKTICVPISAKQGKGIVELLDMLLLTAEAGSANIKANSAAVAAGTVIETNIDKGAGPIATILVQNGTLEVGDQLTANGLVVGKVKRLNNYQGEQISRAGPSVPAQVIGLKFSLQIGDIVRVGQGEKIKKKRKTVSRLTPSPTIRLGEEENDQSKKINLIVKGDVLGSVEAIEESLEKINTPEIKIKIIRKGLGNITDGDLKQAEAANAQVIGFNVVAPHVIEELAREKGVDIKIYNIIYNLINDIKERMQTALEPATKRVDLGKLKVMAVFKTEKTGQIVGGRVNEGVLESGAFVEVWRDSAVITRGRIIKLQSAKQDVGSCEKGEECGLQYEGEPIIIKGDILNVYKEKKIINKI